MDGDVYLLEQLLEAPAEHADREGGVPGERGCDQFPGQQTPCHPPSNCDWWSQSFFNLLVDGIEAASKR